MKAGKREESVTADNSRTAGNATSSKASGIWSSRPWLIPAALMLLAFALRVVHVIGMRSSPDFADPVMDPLYHLDWARALSQGQTFQPGPFFRAPLYPWFLSGLLRIFGGDLFAVRMAQCLLGSLGTLGAYLLAKRAFGLRCAVLAGLLFATHWVLIYFDGELLIPTLIVPLNLFALRLSLDLSSKHMSKAWVYACGLLWGLSCIARPNPLLFLPVLALGTAWLMKRSQIDLRAIVLRVGLLTCGVLSAVLPITAYNLSQGEAVLISTQAGVNFWIGNNPLSDGSSAIVPGTRGDWWGGYYDSIAQASAAEGHTLNASEVSQHYSGRTWSWIKSDPGASIRLLLWKLRLFWTDWELGNNQDVRFFANHFGIARFLPPGFGLFGGFGLWAALALVALCSRNTSKANAEAPSRWPIWSFLAIYCLGVVAFFVCSRFRIPFLAVLLIPAAQGFWSLFDGLREGAVWLRKNALVLAAALLLCVFSLRVPAAIETNPANGYLQLAQSFQRHGDGPKALEYSRAALREDANNRFALRMLGTLVAASGQPAEGLGYLQQSYTINADDPETLLAMARIEITNPALIAQATAHARRAVELAPSLESAHYEWGRALLSNSNATPAQALQLQEQAIGAFSEALRLNPQAFHAAFALGSVQLSRQDLNAAAEALGRAVDLRAHGEASFVTAAYESLIQLLEQTGQTQAREHRQAEFNSWRSSQP